MKIPLRSVGVASRTFTILRMMFFFFFFVMLLINAVSIGMREKDFGRTIAILGKAFYDPLNSASETADKITMEEHTSFFNSLFKYFNLYYNLYIIYLWLWLFTKLGGMMPWSSTSQWFGNFLFAILIFYFVQIIFNVAFLGNSINTPFIKTWEILKGLFHLFSNPEFSTKVIPIDVNNSCVDGICQV